MYSRQNYSSKATKYFQILNCNIQYLRAYNQDNSETFNLSQFDLLYVVNNVYVNVYCHIGNFEH